MKDHIIIRELGLTVQAFRLIWHGSDSLLQVAGRLGVGVAAVRKHAAWCRRLGLAMAEKPLVSPGELARARRDLAAMADRPPRLLDRLAANTHN